MSVRPLVLACMEELLTKRDRQERGSSTTSLRQSAYDLLKTYARGRGADERGMSLSSGSIAALSPFSASRTKRRYRVKCHNVNPNRTMNPTMTGIKVRPISVGVRPRRAKTIGYELNRPYSTVYTTARCQFAVVDIATERGEREETYR